MSRLDNQLAAGDAAGGGTAGAPACSARAEWIVLLVALSLPSLVTWIYFILLSGQPAMKVAYVVAKTVQFGLPLVWVMGVCRERPRLNLKPSGGMALGIGFGLLVVAAVQVVYYGWLKSSPAFGPFAERLQEKVTGMGALSPVRFILLGAFISVIHSFLEEYYWRWFVYGRLRTLVPVGWAVLVSSIGFMAHHVLVVGAYVDLEHWPVIAFLSVSVAVGGAFWAWLYQRTGSLLAPWISHLLVDVALIVVGYDQLWGLGR